MKDDLGDRMKAYEKVTQTILMPRTYTIIRLDGRAFHTKIAKHFEKPFCDKFMQIMDKVAMDLCNEVQNAVCAFVQSDEISLLLTDFAVYNTQQWFGGNIQKIVSVTASIATASFNSITSNLKKYDDVPLAHFDSRVFQVPTRIEAINYFIWRQKDCARNHINAVGQTFIGKKKIHGWSQKDILDHLEENNIEIPFKESMNGRLVDGEFVWYDLLDFTVDRKNSAILNILIGDNNG